MKEFNEAYLNRLKVLIVTAVMRNWKLVNQFGATFTAQTLLHETTPNSLKSILRVIKKKISEVEDNSTWEITKKQEEQLQELKLQEELVDTIIGYKIFLTNREEALEEKAQLEEQLKQLEEESMTPEERKAKLRERIKALSFEEETKEEPTKEEKSEQNGQTISQ